MNRARPLVTALVIVAVLEAKSAWAQGASESAMALVVPGFVYQQATFGDDDPRSTAGQGLTLGVQIRGPRPGSKAFVFEGTFQPNALENPHYSEHFAPLYVQAGLQIGRRWYVRPSGGVALQSGSLAPVLGVAIGSERRFGTKYVAALEFVVRASGSAGLFGWMAGVQIPIGPTPRER